MARLDGAQPLVSLECNGRPCYSPAFTMLSPEDREVVRAQGEALTREWAESQAAQAIWDAGPVTSPRTLLQELTEAIGDTSAALLATLAAFNRWAGALRAGGVEVAKGEIKTSDVSKSDSR